MSSIFPALPISGVVIPSTPLIVAAHKYCAEHTSPTTMNHTLRSCAFSLLMARKLPPLVALTSSGELDTELVVLGTIMHDLGWATTKSLRSTDKRFEVDGANLARAFVQSSAEVGSWDKHRQQLLWDSIALHTTPSIGHHKEPEVFAVSLGITIDFLGTNIPIPGNPVSVEEYTEIVKAFPRLGFKEEVIEVMCGLCKDKKSVVFDNFVGEFGLRFGLDGKGGGKEEFTKEYEKHNVVDMLLGGLDGCRQIEQAAGLPN